VAANLRLLNTVNAEVVSTDLGNILRSASGSVTLTAHNNGDVPYTQVSVEVTGADDAAAWVTINGLASPQNLGALAAGAEVDFTIAVAVPADGSQEAHAFGLKLTCRP
jgi:hypothetical protein